jgi:hypothetical protein
MQRKQRVYRELGVQQALVRFQIIDRKRSRLFVSLLKNITLDPSGHLPNLINLLTSVLTNQWVSGLIISSNVFTSGTSAPPWCPGTVSRSPRSVLEAPQGRIVSRSPRLSFCSAARSQLLPVPILIKVNFIFKKFFRSRSRDRRPILVPEVDQLHQDLDGVDGHRPNL